MYDKKHSIQQHAFFCELVEKYPGAFFGTKSVSDNSVVLQRFISIYKSDHSDADLNQRILNIFAELKKSSPWQSAITSARSSLSESEPKKLAELQSLLN